MRLNNDDDDEKPWPQNLKTETVHSPIAMEYQSLIQTPNQQQQQVTLTRESFFTSNQVMF